MSYILRFKSYLLIPGSWLLVLTSCSALGSLLLVLFSCSTPVGDHHPEWKKYFDEYHVQGCIEIFDLQHSKFIDYNPDRCAERFIPASTFKICNSLIALETKTIPDTNYVIKWDSVVRNIPSWNHDQSMNEAFHNSTVWYYQEVARRIGADKMQQYLHLLHYGNMNPGGAIDSFWLNGDLRISCDEQIEFLKDIYTHQLRLSKRTIDLVKGMMVLEKNPEYTLSGKTGWGMMKDDSVFSNSSGKKSARTKNIGWFVGYVEKGDDVYFFATNIESPETAPENFGDARKAISIKCFQDLHVLQ